MLKLGPSFLVVQECRGVALNLTKLNSQSQVTVGWLLNLSEPQFTRPQNEDNTYFFLGLWELDKAMKVFRIC